LFFKVSLKTAVLQIYFIEIKKIMEGKSFGEFRYMMYLTCVCSFRGNFSVLFLPIRTPIKHLDEKYLLWQKGRKYL